ncbi:Bromodomain-containing protein, partial [Aspergillus costaricaensis CBS 115574]
YKQAWPFFSPVIKDKVPDYYKVIESPMDLSPMKERLEYSLYSHSKAQVDDLKLIFCNSQQYNNITTVYAKSASTLEKYLYSLIKEIPGWFDLLEDKYLRPNCSPTCQPTAK